MRAVLLFLIIPLYAECAEVTVRFKESAAVIPNPERGFTATIENLANYDDAAELADYFQRGIRVVHAKVLLNSYRSGRLPLEFVATLRSKLQLLAKAGLKCILRFQYNSPANETEYKDAKDASFAVVKDHLRTLAPVLKEYEPVILALEAGFIGAWGEWHSSSNKLDTPVNKLKVRDAILAAITPGLLVQFRYPSDLMTWFPSGRGTIDTGDGKWRRIGFHNDCFLASPTDVGTYPSAAPDSPERRYIQKLLSSSGMGGETCNPSDDPNPVMRNSCRDILKEGALYSVTTLNEEYYRQGFHDRWHKQGCYEEIEKKLGYRLSLVSFKSPKSVRTSDTFITTVEILNSGWAAPIRDRVLIFHFEPAAGRRTAGFMAQVSMTGLRPGAHTLNVPVTVPSGAPVGEYSVVVSLPDPNFPDDPRFSIKPANLDQRGQRWDAERARFHLGTSLMVQP